ncbi:class I SAM-dependent methyltransferase [Actinopolymorpha alba]|uniref:class I SAM-dependent methyltransferase n=1 Tax=Actinopolymorpha alba TaxID=533267 RepID=UPI00058FA7F7
MGSVSSDQSLRLTFDSAASLYQNARPDYPSELYDDLIAVTGVQSSAHLLEVGCATGKATLPLARMGFRITALELGENLAAHARRNLAEFPEVTVVTTPFEKWRPDRPHSFDLVYAATVWHWLDPQVRYAKAAELLAPGGHLAIWEAAHGFPADFDPFFAEIQTVYEQIGEDKDDDEWPPPLPETRPDSSTEFESSGHFETVAVRRYVWGRRYTADSYLALLNTFSGHIAMEPAKREYLYAEIRRRLAERPDGKLTRHWVSVLTVGRRV